MIGFFVDDGGLEATFRLFAFVLAHRDPGAELLNQSARDAIVARAQSLGRNGDANVLGCLGDIELARRRLRSNANVLLTLESVFLALYRRLQ